MSDDWRLALTAWVWWPSVVAGITTLTIAYLAAVGPLRERFPGSSPLSRSQVRWYLLGLGVILFALVSPLDVLGDEYLFSAHMTQHVLITLVAPPLLLLGTPGWLLRPALSLRGVALLARALTHPLVAFALFDANLIFWHLPALYDATLHSEPIHVAEHLLFMSAAVIAWWPILSPLAELPRLSYPRQILYLFLQALPMTVLSAVITFAPFPLYEAYIEAPRLFGLSVMADQEIAGLIMWMPGGMVYFVAMTIVFFRWTSREEHSLDGQAV